MSYFGIKRTGNPNPPYDPPRVDEYSTGNATKKWLPFVNPIANEAKEPKIKGPGWFMKKEREKEYLAKLGQASAVEQAGIFVAKHQGINEEIENAASEKYRTKFEDFMRGLGSDEEYKLLGFEPSTFRTIRDGLPAARNEPLSVHPTVLSYLDSTVDSVMNYQRDLAKLKLKAQSTGLKDMSIDEIHKLYKYYILGLTPEPAPAAPYFHAAAPSQGPGPNTTTPLHEEAGPNAPTVIHNHLHSNIGIPPPDTSMKVPTKPSEPSEPEALPPATQPTVSTGDGVEESGEPVTTGGPVPDAASAGYGSTALGPSEVPAAVENAAKPVTTAAPVPDAASGDDDFQDEDRLTEREMQDIQRNIRAGPNRSEETAARDRSELIRERMLDKKLNRLLKEQKEQAYKNLGEAIEV